MKIHVSFLGYSRSGKNLKFSEVSGSATKVECVFLMVVSILPRVYNLSVKNFVKSE